MRILSLVILISLSGICLRAANKRISFEYLGIEHGLSQVSAKAIAQDKLGRLWIGTRDGLNMYDGIRFKTFRQVHGNTNSLLGSNVTALFIKEDNVWIATLQGVSCLNTRTLAFKRFPVTGVYCITEYGGRLLAGSEKGLLVLDTVSGRLLPEKTIFTRDPAVARLYMDNEGKLWLGTSAGLYVYDDNNLRKVPVVRGPVTAVFRDTLGNVWTGTSENGVYLFDNHFNLINHFTEGTGENDLSNNIIRDIVADQEGNIWIGTFMGLNVVDPENLTIEKYLQSDPGDYHISHNSVYSILKDQQGTMWIGTWFGGLNYYNQHFRIDRYYSFHRGDDNGIGYPVVGKMVEDDDGNIWIATEGGGLDFYDRQKGIFKHYRRQKENLGLPENNVRSIYPHGKNHLLIGTHLGGLSMLDLKKGKFTNFTPDRNRKNGIVPAIVNDIIPSGDNYLLATHNGVIVFNPVSLSFTPFFKEESAGKIGSVIFSLKEDSSGKLWIGTEKNGLFSYNKANGQLKHYAASDHDSASLFSNTINQIYEDHRFRIWIGTLGGGLSLYLPEQDRFRTFTSGNNQLTGNMIYGIQESRFGNIWIAESRGLTRFDPEKNRFYNYVSEKGFPLAELNEGALLLTRNGEIFVGGIAGLISFPESDILKKPVPANLIFTSLSVNNQEVLPGDKTRILDQDLPYTCAVTLGPRASVFSISFASCNYISTYKNKFRYKLEHFDQEWMPAGNNPVASYTNLNPGRYTLQIREQDGMTGDILSENSLSVRIRPPFYRTWLAYLCYGLLFISVAWWLNNIYLTRARLIDRIKAEEKEMEQNEKLNRSKIDFFTNISHEFRTPLTLITGIIDSLMEESRIPVKVFKQLRALQWNNQRLNNLIDELMDFSKISDGHLKIRVSENDLVLFLDEIFHSFSEYAHHRHICYTYRRPPGAIPLWFDPRQVEKIFYNLLSNAFKVVADSTGELVLGIEEKEDHTAVYVKDNGPGLTESHLEKIFDRFYQIDNVSGKASGKGTGIGLALSMQIAEAHHGTIEAKSKIGEGTIFTVILLKGNAHFSQADIAQKAGMISTGEPELSGILTGPDPEHTETGSPLAGDSLSLLIVEDNDEVRKLLRNIFSGTYRIWEAADGQEGLEMANKLQPDLIISDVMMPKLPGTEMCAMLKRNIQTSHIPVILLTARTSLEYKIEGLETGADDYITKPFSIQLLKVRVRNILLNRMNMRQLYQKDPAVDISEVTTNPVDRNLLEKMHGLIEKNIDNPAFDVNIFAREIGMGRTRLFTKIKYLTGQTPNDFILTYRLKKAAGFLQHRPEMNVSEIAWAVGFTSPRYFSQCFRDHFGVTPSRYGKRGNKQDPGDQEDKAET